MTDILNFIAQARKRGVIDDVVQGKLLNFERELSSASGSKGSAFFSDLDQPSDKDDETVSEASEAPRFVRGFHDVLITIGILIALGGLWVLGGPAPIILAIIVLSEVFVKRQHLALPAFTLTLLLLAAVGVLFSGNGIATSSAGIVSFGAQLVALAAYYWRYRVPIALAALIWSAFGLVFFVILAILAGGVSPDKFVEDNTRLAGVLGLALTGCMFTIAMKFDMADRLRVTRRSDVAFWIHLATAPLLLYSLFFTLFGAAGFLWAEKPEISQAMAAIGIIMLMVLVGIVIDRRAFVTSGLISLGAAVAIITKETGVDISSVTAFAFLAVGIIVLLLGTGWQMLRGFILQAMPEAIQIKVPPVKR